MRSFIALSTLSFLLKVCVLVEGRYVVEVRLNGYTNPSGKCNSAVCYTRNGQQICCDGVDTSKCMDWERCDSYFVYCLKPLGTVVHVLGCFDNEIRAVSAPNINDGPGIDFSLSKVLDLSNPQNFPGLGNAYEGIQLYIEVIDDDPERDNRNEHVDIFPINHNLTVAESLRLNHTGFYQTVTMDLTITVFCAENFGGSDCTQCAPGFIGPDCNETDHCSGVSCGDNGVCRNVVSSQFQCTCSPGFTGMFCETNIDGCVGVDCSGNGNQSGGTGSARGGAGDVGAIAGGVVGALLAIVVLLILVMVAVVIILKHYNNRKEVNKGNVNSGPLPGDNPVYEQVNATSELKGDSSLNTRTPVTATLPEGGTENGWEERNFDNFIYGDDINDNDDDIDDGGHIYTAPFDQQDQQSLHDSHEFDNPMYGTNTSDS